VGLPAQIGHHQLLNPWPVGGSKALAARPLTGSICTRVIQVPNGEHAEGWRNRSGEQRHVQTQLTRLLASSFVREFHAPPNPSRKTHRIHVYFGRLILDLSATFNQDTVFGTGIGLLDTALNWLRHSASHELDL